MSDTAMAYGVSWSQQYGAKCPACGVRTKRAHRHGKWGGTQGALSPLPEAGMPLA